MRAYAKDYTRMSLNSQISKVTKQEIRGKGFVERYPTWLSMSDPALTSLLMDVKVVTQDTNVGVIYLDFSKMSDKVDQVICTKIRDLGERLHDCEANGVTSNKA